jgi:hypothetical protein
MSSVFATFNTIQLYQSFSIRFFYVEQDSNFIFSDTSITVLPNTRSHNYIHESFKQDIESVHAEGGCWALLSFSATFTPTRRFLELRIAVIQRTAEFSIGSLNSVAIEKFTQT